jgi:hypothetical protein
MMAIYAQMIAASPQVVPPSAISLLYFVILVIHAIHNLATKL